MHYRLFLTLFALTIALLPLLALAEENDDPALRKCGGDGHDHGHGWGNNDNHHGNNWGHGGDDWNNHGHNWGHGGDWNHHGGGWNNHGHGWDNGHGKGWNADNKNIKKVSKNVKLSKILNYAYSITSKRITKFGNFQIMPANFLLLAASSSPV